MVQAAAREAPAAAPDGPAALLGALPSAPAAPAAALEAIPPGGIEVPWAIPGRGIGCRPCPAARREPQASARESPAAAPDGPTAFLGALPSAPAVPAAGPEIIPPGRNKVP